ncbi:hypothetical protein CRE_03035 [Caenorhabditis remanei]|uniref:Uncharacterized protein n=1 Tax=Caenorhabditis remanei TaxID=31234 RepID=E3LW83_CAERE|nr:hypothetical protein CRE_03035 [Caenorhabditis remanei]
MKFFITFSIYCFIFFISSDAVRIWHKSDLPQFRPKKEDSFEPTSTGPRNRIMDWKKSLAFEKVTRDSNVFCRVYGLCSHYSFGVTLLNVLAKWKERGMIYPYKKYDGKPDADIPMPKLENFVRELNSNRTD